MRYRRIARELTVQGQVFFGRRCAVNQLPHPRTPSRFAAGSSVRTMSSSRSGCGLPFTYVRIPADGAVDVEELDGEALGYAGDALPGYLARTRFASSGAPAASSSSGPQADQTARVLAAASEGRSETFALVHPSSSNGSRGVYLYLDEVGKLKNAPPNARATELAKRCGLEMDGDFHGDAFVGAVSVQPRTTNVSFSANELEPDAPWLVEAPRENAAYAVAMRQFRDAVAAKQVSAAQRAAIEADRSARAGDSRETSRREPTTPHNLTSKQGLETYFESLVAERNAPVVVTPFTGRGNGVRAARDVRAGETLWAESPLASTQTAENARAVLACASCHRSVGAIDAQLRLAAGRIDALEAAAACLSRERASEDDAKGRDGELLRVGAKTEHEADRDEKECEKASRPFSALPGFEAARGIPQLVPCRNRGTTGCPAVYCSPECLLQHAARGHDAACCGAGDAGATAPDAPDASDGNETFFSARSAAVAAARAFRRDCGHHDNLALAAELVGSIAERLRAGDSWLEATKACRGLAGGAWWDVSGEDDRDAQARLRGIAARSAALLSSSARAAAAAARAELDGSPFPSTEPSSLDSPRGVLRATATRASAETLAFVPEVLDRLGSDGFGRLLGMCDLNQWGLRVDGPMRNVTRELLRVDENDGADATRATLDALLPLALEAQARRDAEDLAAGRPRWGGDEAEDEEDDDLSEIRVDETSDAEDLYDVSRRLFPMFAGQALFPLLCLVNHSCAPSATTRYSSWKGRTMVRVEALRDVRKGEELSVSYVDETQSLAEREKALAAYGFACACPLCAAQRGKRNAADADDVDD